MGTVRRYRLYHTQVHVDETRSKFRHTRILTVARVCLVRQRVARNFASGRHILCAARHGGNWKREWLRKWGQCIMHRCVLHVCIYIQAQARVDEAHSKFQHTHIYI